MESWKRALSRNKLPKPLGAIAGELGEACRPECGAKMPSDRRLEKIRE